VETYECQDSCRMTFYPAMSVGVVRAGGLIHRRSPLEDRDVTTCMPIIGRDKPNRAEVMVMIVPRQEGDDPSVGFVNGRKGLCRKGRAVLKFAK
jgi:hypothetical protein